MAIFIWGDYAVSVIAENRHHLKEAREIASSVMEKYGDFSDAQWEIFRTQGIWNDHPAVQAVLIALARYKK